MRVSSDNLFLMGYHYVILSFPHPVSRGVVVTYQPSRFNHYVLDHGFKFTKIGAHIGLAVGIIIETEAIDE